MFNSYTALSKIKNIKQAQQDFYNLYGIELQPSTSKPYFYFILHDNKKYIHRDSLRFYYSNGDTYMYDEYTNYCNLTKEFTPIEIEEFLIKYTGKLLPKLLEVNDSFLVYEYVEGEPLVQMSSSEFYTLKEMHEQLTYSLFYNSVNENIIKTTDGFKIIDFKHFAHKEDKPFFIYFEFKDKTELHIDECEDVQSVLSFIEDEYTVHNMTVYYYNKEQA